MKAPHVVRGFSGWPDGPLHLAIGVFDGVHRGHQELVRRLRDGAREAKALAVAATFDPLPIQILAPGAPPSALSEASERAELLAKAGADVVVIFAFDASFAAVTAREFVARVMDAGAVRRIVVGPDFRFGHDRQGDVALLAALTRGRGAVVDVVAPLEMGGDVVSSTHIRNLLLAGDVRAAAGLLGRPYSVGGRIVHGERRGRALGYPTINVASPRERLLPRDGIYATWTTIGGALHAAATSLGVRPTFGTGERVLESFLLDFSGELYGEEADTSFIERLRDEMRFDTPDALVRQIAKDVERTRDVLRGRSVGG